MDANQYKQDIGQWRDTNGQNLTQLAQWADQHALPWLWTELAGILGETKLNPLQPEHAFRQGLQSTPADRAKMPLKPNFYHAHLTMLDSEARKYIDVVSRFNAATTPYAPNASIYNLHGGLEALMDHGIILLEQAGHCLLELPGAYGAWSRRQEHPIEIFNGARTIIYGRFSGLAHDQAAPFTPVAVLRTALENRLRSAFGIYGYLDPRNGGIRPIDLSQLFEAIEPHLDQIKFAVDFHDVVKVYKWSNPYLHAGWRDFIWVPGYALQFLKPLFMGNPGATNFDDGIRMPREVWRTIRSSFANPVREPFLKDIWNAIVTVFKRRRAGQVLQLNDADERSAMCVFLD